MNIQTKTGVNVLNYAGTLAAGSAATLTIPANTAPNFIAVNACARMSVISGQGEVACTRQITMNATVIGVLKVDTYALGGSDTMRVFSNPGFCDLMIAGVDYDPKSSNTINMTARVENSGVEVDEAHFLSVGYW